MDPDDTTQLPPITLCNQPWALQPEALQRVIAAHRNAALATWARLAMARTQQPKAARRSAGQRAGGSVAVIPLTGIITPRGSFLSMLFGGGPGGLMGFRQDFREALASPDVGAIVLDVDSPGGLAALVPETAAEIFDARGDKPIVAVANTLACSAAYYIASQADELVVTPSGDVGSIGTYMVHEDWSGFNEQLGVVPTYVYAGRYKIEGNEDNPLTEEALADWQQHVDLLTAEFVDAVAGGRGVAASDVEANYGEGRTLHATQALDAGMVDRVATIEEVISGLLAPGGLAGGATARAVRAATIITPSHQDDPAAAAADPPEEPADAPDPAEPAADPPPDESEAPADPPEEPPATTDPDAPAETPAEVPADLEERLELLGA